MDRRDQIILQHAPLTAAPRFTGYLPGMAQNSHRFIAGEDGLYLSVRRPWLRLRERVALSEIPLPYGKTEPYLALEMSEREIAALTLMFIHDARDALPNEAAAWVVWDDEQRRPHYRPLTPDHASPGAISYQRPVLAAHESLAIDLHSHGDAPAFWSPTDDEDDTGEVKLAIVIGEVNEARPSIRMRLCALGLFIDMDSPL